MKPTPKCSLFNSLSFDRSNVKVKVRKRSKTYFGHNTLSFHLIHMKPMPKCLLFNSLSSDRSKVKVTKRSKIYFGHNTLSFRPIYINQHQSVHFSIPYPLIGQRSRSRSLKGQKYILVITRSFLSDSYETNAKMFKSLSSDMVTNVALAKVCALSRAT